MKASINSWYQEGRRNVMSDLGGEDEAIGLIGASQSD